MPLSFLVDASLQLLEIFVLLKELIHQSLELVVGPCSAGALFRGLGREGVPLVWPFAIPSLYPLLLLLASNSGVNSLRTVCTALRASAVSMSSDFLCNQFVAFDQGLGNRYKGFPMVHKELLDGFQLRLQ